MINYSWLEKRLSDGIFSSEAQHVEVRLSEVPNAEILWINRRVASSDPAFRSCGNNISDYRAHILKSCAFRISENSDAHIVGVADRYGGLGMGHNGGSGRAAVINGYHVKGIGRTPLVSVTASDEAHASGGAYLEECIRETIFSEIVAAEFPHGAVPVLAIIDTGLLQRWYLDEGFKDEKICLLVRPAFLRPAHLERARSYIATDPRDGYLDSLRVENCFLEITGEIAVDGLLRAYDNLWSSWAEQLAYSFAHRLPHGSDSTSNIAMNGSLVDFGGMTGIPTWARTSLVWGAPATGQTCSIILHAIKTHAKALGLRLEGRWEQERYVSEMSGRVTQRYQQALYREMLRVCGLPSRLATSLARVPAAQQALSRIMRHFQSEQISMIEGSSRPRITWDLDLLWSEDCPSYLIEVRGLAATASAASDVGDAQRLELLRARSLLRSRSRFALFRDEIKSLISDQIERILLRNGSLESGIEELITSVVLKNRRDDRAEPLFGAPIGFARDSESNYTIYRNVCTEEIFCIPEVALVGAASLADRKGIMIRKVNAEIGEIIFNDSCRRPFRGQIEWVSPEHHGGCQ